MDIARARSLALVITVMVLAGLFDSQGYYHATKIWRGSTIVWGEVAKSAGTYALGTLMFWLAVRLLQTFGDVPPEVQTALAFAVIIVGVAAVSGRALSWRPVDQIVAVVVLAGIGWLLFRTAE